MSGVCAKAQKVQIQRLLSMIVGRYVPPQRETILSDFDSGHRFSPLWPEIEYGLHSGLELALLFRLKLFN